MVAVVRLNSPKEELPSAAVLLPTGFQHGQDAPGPLAPPRAARALRLAAEADHRAQGLLRQIIGRRKLLRLGEKTEQMRPMFELPGFQGGRWARRRTPRLQEPL